MAGFSRAERQKIIDDYLNETGQNQFVPADFIDWLGENPDHEAYEWFYGQDDATAAREHRIGMARAMANGLRITASFTESPSHQAVTKVTVRDALPQTVVREFPALVSPMAGRKAGGGYQPFSTEDPAMVDELTRQGAQALEAWLSRYRGVMELRGIDVGPIEQIAAWIKGGVVNAA